MISLGLPDIFISKKGVCYGISTHTKNVFIDCFHRYLTGDIKKNGLYVEYTDGGKTYFDCDADPWQTKNVYTNLSASDAKTLAAMLSAVRDCKGSACP